MMRTIVLHGEMGKVYGERRQLDVFSLAEVVRALCSQIKGLSQYIEQHDFQIIRGKPDSRDYLDEREIEMGFGRTEEVHIIPVLEGAGGDAKSIGKIIAGALLAGFSFFVAPGLNITTIAGMSVKSVGMVGVGLMFAGVSALLAPQPKDQKDNSSDMFGNIPGPAEQGGCVPVAIGRILVTGMPVISSRIITSKVAIEE